MMSLTPNSLNATSTEKRSMADFFINSEDNRIYICKDDVFSTFDQLTFITRNSILASWYLISKEL